MADLSDVENAIKTLLLGIVYPNGAPSNIAQVSAVLNGSGSAIVCTVERGWPQPNTLDKVMAAGNMLLSVFPRNVERNTTRYSTDYLEVSRETATITAVVDNTAATVTIGGANNTAISQFVTIIIDPRWVVSYAMQSSDTPQTIAQALAALISAQYVPASVVGSTITLQTSAYLVANVGVTGEQISLLKQQSKQIQITLWCPDPTTRDNAARLVDPVLADTPFLFLPDGSFARFRYVSSSTMDEGQKQQVYRRDLIYDADYSTTKTDTATEVTSVTVNNAAGNAAVDANPGNPETTSVYPQASA